MPRIQLTIPAMFNSAINETKGLSLEPRNKGRGVRITGQYTGSGFTVHTGFTELVLWHILCVYGCTLYGCALVRCSAAWRG